MIGLVKKIAKIFVVLLVVIPLLFPLQITHAATDVKNDPTLSTNLIAYWELEETGGSTRVDSHATGCGGSGCDLSDNNTVEQNTDCKQGNCADFEDTNTEFLSHADDDSFNCGTACSFAGWARFEATTQQGWVGQWSGGSNAYRFWFTSNQLVWTARSSCGGSNDQQAVSWTPSTETWYHIGVSYDGGANETKFYVDGSQQGSTQTNGINSVCNSTATWWLGRGDDTVDGEMDEWGMWDKVISSGEMSDLYNGGSGIPWEAAADAPPTSIIIISLLLMREEEMV